MRGVVLTAIAVVALLGCPVTIPPATPTTVVLGDASTAVTPENACAHQAALGCVVDANCPAGLANMVAKNMAPVDLVCMVTASTKAVEAKCDGVNPAKCQ